MHAANGEYSIIILLISAVAQEVEWVASLIHGSSLPSVEMSLSKAPNHFFTVHLPFDLI